MEKIMTKRHRDLRTLRKIERDGKKTHSKNYLSLISATLEKDNQPHQSVVHGVKRSGSHSWEEDNHKVSKHKHQNKNEPPKSCLPLTMQDNSMNYTPVLQCPDMQTNNSNNAPINLNKNIYQAGVNLCVKK